MYTYKNVFAFLIMQSFGEFIEKIKRENKTMKYFKSAMYIFCILLCCIMMTACESDDDSFVKSECQVVIDNVIANKQSAAYKAMSLIYPSNNVYFDKKFKNLRNTFDGVTIYKLKRTSRDLQVESKIVELWKNGKYARVIKKYCLYTETFIMTTNAKSYQIAASYLDSPDNEKDGLVAFKVEVLNSNGGPKSFTGTIENMNNASAVQWILFAIAILETLFVIALLIDCYDHNFPKRILWMFIIVLGMVSRNILINDGNFVLIPGIGFILSHTAYITHESGLIQIRILIPVGAILYLALRKQLHSAERKLDSDDPQKSEVEEESAPEDPVAEEENIQKKYIPEKLFCDEENDFLSRKK